MRIDVVHIEEEFPGQLALNADARLLRVWIQKFVGITAQLRRVEELIVEGGTPGPERQIARRDVRARRKGCERGERCREAELTGRRREGEDAGRAGECELRT